MIRKLGATLMLLFCVVGLIFVARELRSTSASPYTDVDVDTAYNMITNGSYPDLVVLDVRTKSEYDTGHIYGTLWIPVTELESRIGELADHKDNEIVVYCLSGGRSATASGVLDSNNFTRVYNMLGGITAWQSSGYQVWIATVHNLNTTFSYDTIQAAIDANQTLNGHTIFVEEGTYYEHVNITKSISLIGENANTTIINGNYTGTVVNISRNNVGITGFTIKNSGSYYDAGITINNTCNCNITKNNLMDTVDAILAISTSNSTISGNNITSSLAFGIALSQSSNNTLCENNFMDNYIFSVLLHSSVRNTISGNNMTDNYGGILLYDFSNENTLTRNNLRNNRESISLSDSSNNTIHENNLEDGSPGISLRDTSVRNTISGNNITDGGYGILLSDFSNENTVTRNHLENNSEGIVLTASQNTITANIIVNNDNGTRLHSSFNTLYHNSFINNTNHVTFYNKSNNAWDNDFEGNFWSNYTGVDLDHDGIGDAEFVLNADNTDRHPLMGVFLSFNTSQKEYVNVVSNSTIEGFEYFESNSTIKMHVSNMTSDQTYGFCRISIPKDLISPPYDIIINKGTVEPLFFNGSIYDNDTHRWIYFAYEHSTLEIVIIPEFPSLLVLPLLVITTLLIVTIYRKKTQDSLDGKTASQRLKGKRKETEACASWYPRTARESIT